MSNLTIANLTTGSELFQDSESFLDELTEREIDNLLGGLVFTKPCVPIGSIPLLK